MKRTVFLLLMAVLLMHVTLALGEIGFAEVKKDSVNMRKAPGGKTIMQLDVPQSVFVFEEKQEDGHLWCHVNTLRGKNTQDGWIRGDMLRFVSDEFTDIMQVQAGDHYVTGIRSDGTVAILGDDMPHMPCIDTVRTWESVAKITSSTCSADALDREGKLLTVGRNSQYGASHAADISGGEPVLLDGNGCILEGSWLDAQPRDNCFPQAARGVAFQEVAAIERVVRAGLTKNGELLWFGADARMAQHYPGAPYTDIDMYCYHLAALRADGRVDAASRSSSAQEYACAAACDVGNWENVVQVAAGVSHTLGLKTDGTVYYAGEDARHRAQVESWTDIAQIDAGNGYSIALKKDGSVVMAGEYDGYIR